MTGRRAEIAGQTVEDLAEPARVRLVLEREQVLEVAEGLRGAVAERDRFLDLEVERDPAVVDAALVLDRDEGEEPLELARAPQLLLLAERSGAEALERRLDLAERGVDRPVVALLGCRDERTRRRPRPRLPRTRCAASRTRRASIAKYPRARAAAPARLMSKPWPPEATTVSRAARSRAW